MLSAVGVAVTKSYALNRSNTWRDYIDIYFILVKKEIELNKLLIESKKVYREMFSEKLFLSQLIYTDDISKVEIKNTPIITGKVTVRKLKKFFEFEIDKLIQ
jgi:hypothetical protein